MTPAQFEILLDDIVLGMTNDARSNPPCLDPKAFEGVVLDALKRACKGVDMEASPAFHQHAFPDLAVNGFGVEVKHTTKDTCSPFSCAAVCY